jgi:tetratricopeptide (TPR) repeat protein
MKKQKKTPPPTSSAAAGRIDAALLVAVLAGFVLLARRFDFVQDDAYITFRYIRNFIDGNGLVFNIGERVEGYTTFLWTMLLALPMKLGVDVLSFSRNLGIVFSLGTIALLWPLSRQVRPEPGPIGFRIIAPLLLASCGAFTYWTVSGMETAMFSFLAVLGVVVYLRERDRPAKVPLTPLIYAAASLTRPEGMFLFGLLGLHRLAETAIGPRDQRWPRLRQLILWTIWYAVPIGAFTLWRLAYYGHFFPNTYYAKAGFSSEYLAAGWEYFLAYARNYLFSGWLLAVPVAVLLWRKRTSEVLYLIGLVLAYAGYIISVGGDVLHAHRFFLVIAPLLYLLVQEAMIALASTLRGNPAPARLAVYGLALVLAYTTYKTPMAQLQDVEAKERGLVEHMSMLGRWIKVNTPPGAVMAATTIGAISYYGEIPLIDMLGLTDSTIAHRPERIEGIKSVWRERKYNVSYVLSRAPYWISFSTGIKPSAFAERALFTRAEFRRWYYPYYFELVPGGYVDVMYKRAEAPLPASGDTAHVDNEFINLYYDGVNRVSRWPADALTLFRKAEAIAPTDFGLLHQMMAEAYGVLRREADAAREDSIAIARDPRLLASRLRLGEQAYRRNDFARAREHFTMVTDLHPHYSGGWKALIQTAAAMGDTAGARGVYERSLRFTAAATTNRPPGR